MRVLSKTVTVIQINSGDSVVALGLGRLFFDADDLAALDFGDAETFRVMDLFEEDFCARRLLFEVGDSLFDGAFDDIVAEDNADFAAVGEVFGEGESVGDAAFPLPGRCN